MYILLNYYMFSISSPYMCVFGDDRVIRYIGGDDVVGGSTEA